MRESEFCIKYICKATEILSKYLNEAEFCSKHPHDQVGKEVVQVGRGFVQVGDGGGT